MIQLESFRRSFGFEWPNCTTPDCGNKICIWASWLWCAPCALKQFGADEMIRRWNTQHPDDPWTESFPPGGKRRD